MEGGDFLPHLPRPTLIQVSVGHLSVEGELLEVGITPWGQSLFVGTNLRSLLFILVRQGAILHHFSNITTNWVC